MNYMPKSGSLPDTICRAMLHRESLTIHEIISLISDAPRKQVIRTVGTLRHASALKLDGKQYSLTALMRSKYQDTAPPVIAPAPAVTGFKPWSGKHSISNVPRREPIRDMSFITIGGGNDAAHI